MKNFQKISHICPVGSELFHANIYIYIYRSSDRRAGRYDLSCLFATQLKFDPSDFDVTTLQYG